MTRGKAILCGIAAAAVPWLFVLVIWFLLDVVPLLTGREIAGGLIGVFSLGLGIANYIEVRGRK